MSIYFIVVVKLLSCVLSHCDPMDYSLPGSSVHGTLQTRILEWVAILFSRGSSWPRDQTLVSCIADRFFTIWATREAPRRVYMLYEHLFLVCLRVTSSFLWLSQKSWPLSLVFSLLQSTSFYNFSSSVTLYSLNISLCPYLRNSDMYWFVSISPDHWSLGFVLLLLVLLLAVEVFFFNSSKVYFFLVFANKQKSVFTNSSERCTFQRLIKIWRA